MINLKDVNKYYGSHHALKNVNLDIAKGEKLVIIGPSGSGKSTAIRCMNGLEEISSGSIKVNDILLTHKSRHEICRKYCSMVFQHFNLYPHLSVLQNLTLAPTKLQKKSMEEARELAFKFLKVVGLEHKASSYPQSLSGGQQQRVAIARELCSQKNIILFDEPTSALDPESVQEVLDIISKISQEESTTMVIVTHEMGFAKQVADRIIFMEDGVILESNKADEFFNNPKNERLKEFLSKILKH